VPSRTILAVVAGGYLLASWAMNPVSSILPTITGDLGIDVTRAGWIMNAYFVLLVGGVLIAGRLGDAFGHGVGLPVGADGLVRREGVIDTACGRLGRHRQSFSRSVVLGRLAASAAGTY